MPTKYIVKEIQSECLPDPDNVDGLSLEGVNIQLFITNDEVERLLAAFDDLSATSPSAADSRSIARPLCIALQG
tara:strand:- start:338 stop:559 length:222 start_codon:yes stop_codon:yes gene_type:complete